MNKAHQFIFSLLIILVFGCKKNGSSPSSNVPKTGTATIFGGNGQGGVAEGKGLASFAGAWGIVADKYGNFYASDYSTTLIRKIAADGTVTTFAGNISLANTGYPQSINGIGTSASFTAPAGMAIDGAGNIYVADKLSIRKITPDGTVSTLPGSNYFNNSNFLELALDASGNIYASDTNNEVVLKINTSGTASVYVRGNNFTANGFKEPLGLTFDKAGNLYLVDADGRIHKITPDKTISTIAGQSLVQGFINGSGNIATFYNPVGICIDAAGNLFVSDYGNRAIREILPNGNVSTVVVTNETNSVSGPYDMVFDNMGIMYLADGEAILNIVLK